MPPIVAPPPKQPIMYPTPNSPDGTYDTLLLTIRFVMFSETGQEVKGLG